VKTEVDVKLKMGVIPAKLEVCLRPRSGS